MCNCQERESVQVYKSFQRISEVRTFRLSSLRLRVLEYTKRELVYGSREFLSLTLEVIGGSVTDLGVGVRSAAAAPFRLLQVLEADRNEGRRQTRRIRRSKFDEAKLQRFGQQAGSSGAHCGAV